MAAGPSRWSISEVIVDNRKSAAALVVGVLAESVCECAVGFGVLSMNLPVTCPVARGLTTCRNHHVAASIERAGGGENAPCAVENLGCARTNVKQTTLGPAATISTNGPVAPPGPKASKLNIVTKKADGQAEANVALSQLPLLAGVAGRICLCGSQFPHDSCRWRRLAGLRPGIFQRKIFWRNLSCGGPIVSIVPRDCHTLPSAVE